MRIVGVRVSLEGPRSVTQWQRAALLMQWLCVQVTSDRLIFKQALLYTPTLNKLYFVVMKSPAIHRTPLYRAKAAYSGMLARCGNRNGKNPSYQSVELRISLKEWLDWSIPQYEEFSQKYGADTSPSVARKGDTGHYELGNISIISWSQNLKDRVKVGAVIDGRKRCSSCLSDKDIENFSKNRTKFDGYSNQCRCCAADSFRKWRESKHVIVAERLKASGCKPEL